MYVGTQNAVTTDDEYRQFAQLGVRHINADLAGNPHDWSLDELLRHRERLERCGLVLDMVQLPLSSRPIEHQQSSDILGKGPARDRQIESICKLVERIAAAGIPSAKYNLNIIGIPRSVDEMGRGGSRNSAFRWDRMDQAAPPSLAGVLPEEENWERIDYFLERIVPVAASNRVRLACHPHDPHTPPGYRGVTRVLGTVEGLKRFVQMRESPWHGLNFCIGTVGEMLDDPRAQINDVIRWFGERGKIFNIHYRNIIGRKLSFMEAFPDEGDMDMWGCLRVLAELGYQYMVMPDHVPHLSGTSVSYGDAIKTDYRDVTMPDHAPVQPGGANDAAAFAYCFGYIRALLQVLKADYPDLVEL